MAAPRVRVQLDLPPELDKWLRDYAALREVSRNTLITEFLGWWQRAIETGDKSFDHIHAKLGGSRG